MQNCEKGPLRHWLTATLVKLRSRDFDSVAPFELLQQLFLTRAAIFSPGESADTADALHLLLETCLSDISLVAPVRALTGQEMCRYWKLIRSEEEADSHQLVEMFVVEMFVGFCGFFWDFFGSLCRT